MEKCLVTIDVIQVPKKAAVPLSPKIMGWTRISKKRWLPDFLYPKELKRINYNLYDILVLYKNPNYTYTQTNVDSLYDIIKEKFDVSLEQIKGPRGKDNIVFARQLFHYAYVKLNLGSKSAAGRETNNNHCSVLHSIKTVENAKQIDKGWRKDWIKKIDDALIKITKQNIKSS